MKAEQIRRKLRELDVPLERAVWAAQKYGDDTNPLSDTQKAQKAIEREARKVAQAAERRKFRLWCKSKGLPIPTFECYFAKPERDFRWDVAWEPELVALEIQGGIWRKGGGAHTGRGHLRDIEKINLGQKLGWVVLQCTPDKLYTPLTLELLEDALNARTRGITQEAG